MRRWFRTIWLECLLLASLLARPILEIVLILTFWIGAFDYLHDASRLGLVAMLSSLLLLVVLTREVK